MAVTNFTIASSSHDDSNERNSSSWGTVSGGGGTYYGGFSSRTEAYIAKSLEGGSYWVSVAYLRWNTSSIPDTDIISAADLQVYPNTISGGSSRNLQGDWFNWGTGADSGDWAFNPTPTAFSGVQYNLWGSGYQTIPLSGLENINKTGDTYIRLTLDGTGTPSGTNKCHIRTYDYGSSYAAKLVVTHAPAATSSDSVGMIYA
jgi:hypothetical protein